jgi:glutamine synthetase adenylyltransferase
LLSYPDLIAKRKGNGIIESLMTVKNNLINEVNFGLLIRNFSLLKKFELVNQNTFNTKVSKIPTDEKKLTKLALQCEFKNGSSFMKKLNDVSLEIKKEFQKILN